MNRYLKIILSLTFFCSILLPWQVFGASITEKHAAIGEGCTADGDNATAMGYYSTADGDYSTAIGYGTRAENYFSIAMGYATFARGDNSIAMGSGTAADGGYSFVIGYGWNPVDHKLVNDVSYSFMVGFMGSETDTTPEFFVKDGAVGIGTKYPQNLLDLGTRNGKKLAVYQNSSGTDFYGFGISTDTLEFHAGAGAADTPAMVLKKGTNRVGIGTVTPNYTLEVVGTAAKSTGTTWINSSDVRLKNVTGNYAAGLGEIVGLRPITFYYKDKNPRGLPTNEEYIGFLAQEVQQVFPESVNRGPDGYLDFNMHPVNVAVINAIKELKAKNDALEAENASLKRDIEKIKAVLGITHKTGI